MQIQPIIDKKKEEVNQKIEQINEKIKKVNEKFDEDKAAYQEQKKLIEKIEWMKKEQSTILKAKREE